MKLTNLVKNFEKLSLSGGNIEQILQGLPIKVMDYKDLENYTSLDLIFNDQVQALILLLTRSYDCAHWVVLLYKPEQKLIEYFDPYGFLLNQDLNISTQDNDYLPRLIQSKISQGCKFSQNTVRIQKLIKDRNTCGAHAIVRCLFRKQTNKDYTDMITGYKKIEPDELVIIMISSYLMKILD